MTVGCCLIVTCCVVRFSVLFSSLGKLTVMFIIDTNVPQVCIWECSMSLKLSLFGNAPFMVNLVQKGNARSGDGTPLLQALDPPLVTVEGTKLVVCHTVETSC